jgi:hypothetical protein
MRPFPSPDPPHPPPAAGPRQRSGPGAIARAIAAGGAVTLLACSCGARSPLAEIALDDGASETPEPSPVGGASGAGAGGGAGAPLGGQGGQGGGAAGGAGVGGAPVDPSAFLSVSVGGGHLCAVRSDGQAFCWGFGGRGQLGTGVAVPHSFDPLAVIGLGPATSIAAGGEHTCALASGGKVLCWGNNEYGQVGAPGTGSGATRPSPTPVALPGPALSVVAGGPHFGGGHSCALLASGDVYCWGADGAGQLGDGKSGFGVHSSAPTPVAGLPPAIVALAAGGMHTCALTGAGNVLCWGLGTAGQLGNGPQGGGGISTTPTVVGALPLPATTIAAGDNQSCAVLQGGRLWCWGEGGFGQFGANSPGQGAPPLEVWGGALVSAVDMAAVHGCVLLADGSTQCAGLDDLGQVASGKPGPFEIHASPVSVAGVPAPASIHTGTYVSCALLASQRLVCWGDFFGSSPSQVVAQ